MGIRRTLHRVGGQRRHNMFVHTAAVASLLMAALLVPADLSAQGFELTGETSLTGTFTLTLFDGDSTSHSLTATANGGLIFFTGEVERPVVAQLEHPAMHQPLFFYVENADISMVINASRPEASVVKGSRSNSEYRYLMEQYRGSDDPNAFLKQWAKNNAGSIYLPFVLHQQRGSLDDAVCRQLVGQVSGEACHTYHYTLLRRWLRETPAVAEGCEMPNFAYLNAQKARCEFAQTRNTEGATLLFFGATWCDRCKQQLDEAARIVDTNTARLLVINIDDNPNGWDAHYLKQLSVDHLPYMIWVDKSGTVVARDIRIWELKKYAKQRRQE